MESTEAQFTVSPKGVDNTFGRKKVIFFTSSEYGRANVILAVAYELLIRQQYEVHIASFAPLKGRIRHLNELAVPNSSIRAVFHTVPGKSFMEALTSKDEYFGPYRPGIRGALETYRVTLPAMATAWEAPDYMTGYENCLEILQSVSPDVIVAGPIMHQGLDACKTLSRNAIILAPNTFKELLRNTQPVVHDTSES